jgi:hypothetical protein
MKSYTTIIRNKSDLTKQSSISSHVKNKYNEIRFMKININSYYYSAPRHIDPNRVTGRIVRYSSFQNCKIINGNYSIYNYTKNNRENRNIIHNTVETYIYPINECAKCPKLTELAGCFYKIKTSRRLH